jgi:hypothetical protein
LRYVAINLLNAWSARTGVSLSLSVQYLLSTVKYQPVPLWENADSGVRVPFYMVKGGLPTSQNGSLLYRRATAKGQRYCLADHVERHRAIHLTRQRRRKWQRPWQHGLFTSFKLYNPSGLMLSFLQGGIVNEHVGVRQTLTRYETKQAVAPSWEHRPPDFATDTLQELGSPARTVLTMARAIRTRSRNRWIELPEHDVVKYVDAFNDAFWLNFFG